MSTGTPPKGQRARRTCVECHRRKIKCDKNIPCGTCTKRGLEDSCRRLEQRTVNDAAVAAPKSSDLEIQNDPALVRSLLDRVVQLEAIIKAGHGVCDLDQTENSELRRGRSQQNGEFGAGLSLESSNARPEAESSPDSTRTAPVPSVPVGGPRPEDVLTPNTDPTSDPDAARVLDFLTYGRRKQSFHEAPENRSGPRRIFTAQSESPAGSPSSLIMDAIRGPQLELLQMLLPEREKVDLLVDYHSKCLLWVHGSFIAGCFDSEVKDFYWLFSGNVKDPQVNLQWLALLFAVLCGSMTCVPAKTVESWGFASDERGVLPKQWYNAAIVSLNLSNYLQDHTIYSVQALSTLAIAAHILGFSKTQSVLLIAATKIAQSLGIHRLGAENEDMDMQDLDNRRSREAGRRVWCHLCTQDWYSIPFHETYSINPAFFDSAKPLNCKDSDMLPLYATTPTITSYCNHLYDIASLLPQLQDAMSASNTLFTKYEKVLAVDDQMRKLATSYMSTFMHTNRPGHETWPEYIHWGRRSLTICASHKIMMIHRKFLGLSFTNNAFIFTRRTCLAAAKTIIKEAQSSNDDSAPLLWIDQAFTVAAGITLSLDILHRTPDEPEYAENKTFIKQALGYLKQFPLSVIAIRGIGLLTFLQHELDKKNSTGSSPDSTRKGKGRVYPSTQMPPPPRPLRPKPRSSSATSTPEMSENGEISNMAFGDAGFNLNWLSFSEMMPPQTGFGDHHVFEDFFANYDFDFGMSQMSN